MTLSETHTPCVQDVLELVALHPETLEQQNLTTALLKISSFGASTEYIRYMTASEQFQMLMEKTGMDN